MQLIDSLNPSQRAAATYLDGHALVLAGAGSGKTKTIIARAAFLLTQGVPPSSIRILTFTRRSADEIRMRVESQMGQMAHGLGASTFHTWCIGLIRKAPALFGAKGFTVIDRDDQGQLFKALRGRSDKKLPTAGTLLDIYSFARNTQKSLSEAIRNFDPELLKIKDDLAGVMRGYEARKQERKYLDYDDILSLVATQIATNDQARAWVTSQHEHLLVDEMQDTNPLQWKLLEPFIHTSKLFCVGDDAQSIYGFRGADFKNVHSFTQRVPNSRVFKLEENYRSTQEILDVSNWLLRQSPIDYDKQLHAARGQGIVPRMITYANEFEEARGIVADITERRAHGDKLRDHMILVRTAFSSRAVEAALLQAEIPYRFVGGTKLLESAHVRDMLSALRILANHYDEIGWLRFLTLFPKMGEKGAANFYDAMAQYATLQEGLDKAPMQERCPPEAIGVLRRLMGVVGSVAQTVKVATAELKSTLASKYENQNWDRRLRDFPTVERLAQKHATVLGFLEEYVLDPVSASEVNELAVEDAVTLITVHSAKGTECKVCYINNLAPGGYPHSRSLGSEDEIEEERRVLYVALTRAKDELIMSRASVSTWSSDEDSRYFFDHLPEALVKEEVGGRLATTPNYAFAPSGEGTMPRMGIDFS